MVGRKDSSKVIERRNLKVEEEISESSYYTVQEEDNSDSDISSEESIFKTSEKKDTRQTQMRTIAPDSNMMVCNNVPTERATVIELSQRLCVSPDNVDSEIGPSRRNQTLGGKSISQSKIMESFLSNQDHNEIAFRNLYVVTGLAQKLQTLQTPRETSNEVTLRAFVEQEASRQDDKFRELYEATGLDRHSRPTTRHQFVSRDNSIQQNHSVYFNAAQETFSGRETAISTQRMSDVVTIMEDQVRRHEDRGILRHRSRVSRDQHARPKIKCLKIATFNMLSARQFRLATMLRELDILHVDLALLTETKLTNDIYPKYGHGSQVSATRAQSPYKGGVAIAWKDNN